MSKKIVIFGNTIFTKEVIRVLFESEKYDVTAWTGNSNKNPVLDYVRQNNIKLIETNPNFDLKTDGLNILNEIKPDLGIVIAFGKILPQSILDIPKSGFINIHLSLLPLLRGATPIQEALMHGLTESGTTIQKMVYKMDEGDILKQFHIKIDSEDNHDIVRQKMIDVTVPNLPNFLDDYFENKVSPVPQEEAKATYCWLRDYTREKGKIGWNMRAEDVHNKIRAFYSEPIAWSEFNGKIINFIESRLSDIHSSFEAGTMHVYEKKLYVATENFDLEILQLVMEGKKPMSGIDFANGILRKDKVLLNS